MSYPIAKNRPDWTKRGDDAENNGYVTITKGTAKLSLSALRYQNSQDGYDNYILAEKELNDLLKGV